MSKISEISNNQYPLIRKMSSGSGISEGFSDVFTEALENADSTSSVKSSPLQNEAGSAVTATVEDQLTAAIKDSLVNDVLTSSSLTGGLNSAPATGYGGIESLLLANAANGEIDDTQLALLMLVMLMGSSGDESDKSMLYSVMSSLLSAMTESSEIKTDAVGSAPDTTTRIVTGWDLPDNSNNQPVQEQITPDIYTGPIKKTVIPDTSPDGAILPVTYWQSATPAIVGSENNRSADNLRKIIDQFDVENAGRYTPRDGYTYCNIFLWDVTSALGCEIPHYVNPDTGEPMTYPDVSGAMELNSNRTLDWLINKGGEYGWREVSAEDAQNSANRGLPAVGVWKNPGSVGHVQVVCPSEDGLYNAEKGPTVAQAGRKTLNYAYQRSIYSATGMSKVRYFVHD